MYNLSLHIEYLLLRHDCVVVPGFGAFINVRQAATFDKNSGIWSPMTREVRFNCALVHDDGLLASSYARKNRVSFAEGRELLRADVHRLHEILDEDSEVTLGQLGILQQNVDTICFMPMHGAGKLAEILGYTAAPIRFEKSSVSEETAASADKDAVKATVDSADEGMEGKTCKFDTSRNYYIPVNKMFARVAACIALIVAVAMSLVMPDSERVKVDEASVLPTENTIRKKMNPVKEAVVKTDSNEGKSAKHNVTVKEEAKPTVEMAAEPTVTARVDSNASEKAEKFHAVVATFSKAEDAEKFIKFNRESGYDLQVINTSTKSRVSAARGNNRAELQQLMRESRFRATFEGAWIWEDTASER